MKQFVIIGLGNFGYYLATYLYDKGQEILAIDKNPDRVQKIKDQVSQAVVADATDRKTLEILGVKDMDAAIVCIGSDLKDSILTTLTLKDIGVKMILAKALSENHGRILLKVGASDILFPEKDLAISLAERLNNPNILDYLPFLEGYSIIQLATPDEFIGKSLSEIDIINRFGVMVVAVKEIIPERLNMIPTGKFILKDSDILILLGPIESLDKLRDK